MEYAELGDATYEYETILKLIFQGYFMSCWQYLGNSHFVRIWMLIQKYPHLAVFHLSCRLWKFWLVDWDGKCRLVDVLDLRRNDNFVNDPYAVC